MKPIVPKPQRCAIYTRKSTEHNLDLEFNSLDAQREACEAYIKSHRYGHLECLARLKARRSRAAKPLSANAVVAPILQLTPQ